MARLIPLLLVLGAPLAIAQTINTHEHIQSEAEVPKLLAVMDDLGIERTVLVGSSWFTSNKWGQ